jgi:hypothetical protein
VPNPQITTTLGITINAPASEIWPWLAQLGQERGGMYSYELLENLARCQMRNVDRIVPEWEMKVGDQMRMGPRLSGKSGHRIGTRPLAADGGRRSQDWLCRSAALIEALILHAHDRLRHGQNAHDVFAQLFAKQQVLAPV